MRRLPNLSALRAFDAAARHGSFTRAAEDLGLTQAAISRHVRNLEDELGIQLFLRGHKTVSLTPAGRLYAKRVNEGFKALEYEDPEAPPTGPRVVVEAESALCRRWLMPLLDGDALDALGLHLDLRVHGGQPHALPVDTDIALTRGAQDRDGFKRFRLLSPRVIAFASPRFGIPSVSETHGARLLHDRTEEDWRLIFKAAGATFPEGGDAMTLSHSDLAIDAALSGLGAGTGDDVLVEHLVKTGQLTHIAGPSLLGRAYYMATRKPRLAPAAARLAQWLMDQAQETARWQSQQGTIKGVRVPRP